MKTIRKQWHSRIIYFNSTIDCIYQPLLEETYSIAYMHASLHQLMLICIKNKALPNYQ